MSFYTMSPAVVRRTAFPSTVVPSAGTAGAAAARGVTGIAAGRQDMLGVNSVDVLQPESSEDLEEEPSSSFSADTAALNNGGSNANNGGGTKRVRAAPATKDRAAAATATATTADPRNRQPTRSLESVRGSLIRQEETIIFALIEREQFRCNNAIYTDRTFRVNRSDAADIYGRDASFLEYMLSETEKLHATGMHTCYYICIFFCVLYGYALLLVACLCMCARSILEVQDTQVA